MTTIWKFELSPFVSLVAMPRNATLLHAGAQGDDTICVWARVNTEEPLVHRNITVVSTGTKLPEAAIFGEHVGTVQLPGPLVFHIFDGGEKYADKAA